MSADTTATTDGPLATVGDGAPRAAEPPAGTGPHALLRDLAVLEGTWWMEGRDAGSGEAFTGTTTRRWLPGGFFMTQQTSVEGRPADGIEYIGYDAATGLLRSMLFSSEGPGRFCPFALECFWSIEGDDLTIWHGSKDSPARFLGTIDRSAGVVRGAWEWPGGGYTATARRTL